MITRISPLLVLLALWLTAPLAQAATVNATYNSATDIPVTASGYTATGNTVNFTLNYAPTTGTELTVVKNTALPFINGTFSNLAQGQVVTLSFGGSAYSFVANYYGGSGNDLVLVSNNRRLFAWGANSGSVSVPSPVSMTGALAGKTVTSITSGGLGDLALSTDGSLVTLDAVPVVFATTGNALAGKVVVAVAAGSPHNAALCSDGTVVTWGSNFLGQLGLGYTDNNSPHQPEAVLVAGTALAGKSVVAISLGEQHSLALCSDGRVVAWGYGNSGELGTSLPSSGQAVAVDVSGVLSGKTVVSIAAGGRHNLALCSDGTLVAWGRNDYGQLGNNITANSNTPVLVTKTGTPLAGKTVVSIAAGGNHSMALCSDGTLVTWGNNGNGQLGNNSVAPNSAVPVAVSSAGTALAGKTVVSITAGNYHSAALCSDGTLATWGGNDHGQLGDGTTTLRNVPVAVSTTPLGAGERFTRGFGGPTTTRTLAVTAMPFTPKIAVFNGAGTSAASELLSNTSSVSFSNVLIGASSITRTFTIQNSGNMSLNNLTLTKAGATPADFTLGSLGSTTLAPNASTTFTVTFSPATAGVRNAVVQIGSNDPDRNPFVMNVTGVGDNVGLSANFTSGADVPVTCEGFNATGRNVSFTLGYTPMTGAELTVVKNTGTSFISGNFTNLSQGQEVTLSYGGITYHFVANYYGGSGNDLVLVWKVVRPFAWGYNLSGGVGDNSTTQRNVPVAVNTTGLLAGKTIVSMSAGGYHSLALCSDGTLLSWGGNQHGQLGDGSTTNRLVPVLVDTSGVLSGKTVVAISAGGEHSLALCSDGTVTAWGYNHYGELGDSSATLRNVPVIVGTLGALSGKTVVAISAGGEHSLALCSDGTLATWGYNLYGQLGDNSNTNHLTPVAVSMTGVLTGKSVAAISAGGHHNLALCSDGTMAAWGLNWSGQVGNFPAASDRYTPVAVDMGGALVGRTVTAISAGGMHSMALCSDGYTVAWGRNDFGAIGDGDNTSFLYVTPTPVAINGVLSGKTVVAIAAGGDQSKALCADGALTAWGYNYFGALGDNSTTTRYAPVVVNSDTLAPGEQFIRAFGGAASGHSLVLVATPLRPEIAVFNGASTAPADERQTAGASLNFVDTSLGASSTQTFTIKNTGVGALTGLALSKAGTHPGQFTFGAPGSATLAPGETTSFTVTFTPVGLGYHGAVVQIASNDLDENPFVINVSGTGVAPEIAVFNGASTTPASERQSNSGSFGFSNPAVGNSSAAQTFTIQNTGTASLTGLSVTKAGSGTPGDFTLGTLGATTLAPGATTTFTATFTPAATGARSAVLQIASNDANENPFLINVDGTGDTLMVAATYSTGTEVPVTSNGYTATGKAVNFTLNYAPTVGTELMVVKNTGLPFISGTFSNLAQGQVLTLSFGGTIYRFVANYYGGSGNDLILVWADNRAFTWGRNHEGQVGDNSRSDRSVPTPVVVAGVLEGRTVLSMAGGFEHSLAICADGTLAAWGRNDHGQLGYPDFGYGIPTPGEVDMSGAILAGKRMVNVAAGYRFSLVLCSDGKVAAWGENQYGQLGDNTTTESHVPVAVNTSGVLSGKIVVAVATGGYHSLALCADGTLVAWGRNSSGQLGDGTTTQRNVPVLVNVTGPLSGKTVTAISAGESHSLALCSDGTLVAWGGNTQGQLGNGTTTSSLTGVAVSTSGVLAGKTSVAITSGAKHNVVLCSDGTLAAWGANIAGEVGDGNVFAGMRVNPVTVTAVSSALEGRTVVSIAAGLYHSLATCSDGSLCAWGYNQYFQLGQGSSSTYPSVVATLVNTSQLTGGERFVRPFSGPFAHHSLAVVATPPSPEIAVFDDAGPAPDDERQSNVGVKTFADTGLGGSSGILTFTIQNTGEVNLTGLSVAKAGLNHGDFSVSAPLAPTLAPNETTTFTVVFSPSAVGQRLLTLQIASSDADENPFVVQVRGTGTSLAINATYTTGTEVPLTINGLTATGNTASFTLNYAPTAGTELMVVKNTGTSFIQGTFTGLAQGQVVPLSFGGAVYNFVANYYGGDGNDLVLAWADARAFAWGYNSHGQLGTGGVNNVGIPLQVTATGVLANKAVLAMAEGQFHTLALCSDGTLAAWGRNNFGQLGDGTTTDRLTPVAVTKAGTPLVGKTVVSVAAGQYHSVALCSDGTVVTWGRNSFGQLGDNSTNQRTLPVAVTATGALAGKSVTAIAAGLSYSLARCADGSMVAWGANDFGQLGDNSTTQRNAPVVVNVTGTPLAGKAVAAIAAGQYHSLALCSDGTLGAWGRNSSGQLGDTTTTQRTQPVAVTTAATALSGKTVAAITAGGAHSVALCTDGSTVAWGANTFGQLGDNSTTQRNAAVAVNTLGALSGKTVKGIAAGDSHSWVLCTDGTVQAWGAGAYGQLGENGSVQHSVAVSASTPFFSPGEVFSRVQGGSSAFHSSGLVSALPTPKIAVFNGNSTAPAAERQSNVAPVTFYNTIGGSGSGPQTFTIKNTGAASLAGLALSKSGTDAAQFTLGTLGATTLAPDATTTFTVTYSSAATGSRIAVVRIASNAENGSSFYIDVLGVENQNPSAGADVIERLSTKSIKVAIQTLLANDTDPENSPLTLTSVQVATPTGATVTHDAMWVVYTPPSGSSSPGSFTYTISDGRGGSATGAVTVNIKAESTAVSQNKTDIQLEPTGGGDQMRVSFVGIPGRQYTVQYTDSLTPANWQLLGTVTADAQGRYEIVDPPPLPNGRFYRAIAP